MIIFKFIYIFKFVISLYYYESVHILELLNKEKEDENELKEKINYISETFRDVYAYNEIAKNPPQPYFYKNYHNKVDIQKSLNEINTYNISFYQLYQMIISKISEFKDLHIDIQFGNKKRQILNDLYSICPIKFYIKKVNGIFKIFCKLNKYNIYYEKTIIDIIEKNQNISILSINKQNPFDFISNFCGNIGKTKNPHGTFSHKFNAHYGYNLGLYPLDFKDLNWEIIYENGKILNFNYIFVTTYEIDTLIEEKLETKEKKDNINNFLFNEYLNHEKFQKNTKKISKLQKEFNEYMNNTENKYNNADNISWDYYYSNSNNTENIFKCRVDDNNKVNVYYIQSFSPKNYTLYKEIFFDCINLFDQNKYPIIVILNKNDGGFADLPKLMLELISPYISISKFMAKKINKYMNKNKTIFNIDNIIEIDYGDNNKLYLSEPLEDLTWINEEIINHKKKIKNKRKPTDILIYTDGYSFSAASTFLKYLQYYGGGIVVGFFGSPKEKNIPFDSGQSSSSIFENATLYIQSPNAYKYLNDKYNITFQMPGNQNFFDDLNLNIPLEYLVMPVDERVEIYQNFKDINYNLFINNI